MKVLGIETSCDDTTASIVENGQKILSNVIYSQSALNQRFGGVFPEMASREHLDLMLPVIDQAILEAAIQKEDIDLIAATYAPGLIGSILIGLNSAKTLSLAWDIPFVGVNHIEAHLYAAMMNHDPLFPSLGVVISGGHTFMVKIKSVGNYEMLGWTQDDAIGEAFDKVAKILGLPFPGGPEIEKLAKNGDPSSFPFKAGKVKKSPYHFSFSGLKTAVLYAYQKHGDARKEDIAASFQRAAFEGILEKIELALRDEPFKEIYIGGGVSASRTLKDLLSKKISLPVYFPCEGLSMDNAAMIAALGYQKYLERGADLLDLEARPTISLV